MATMNSVSAVSTAAVLKSKELSERDAPADGQDGADQQGSETGDGMSESKHGWVLPEGR